MRRICRYLPLFVLPLVACSSRTPRVESILELDLAAQARRPRKRASTPR